MSDIDPRVVKALLALADAFDARLTETRIRAYAASLADVPIVELQAACVAAVRDLRYFPSVDELRSLASPGTVEDAALVAWMAFEHAASSVGAYAPLLVEDPAAADALVASCGSWPEFCAMEPAELKDRRPLFVAAYKQARRGVHPRYGIQKMDDVGAVTLAGLCDADAATAAVRWAGRLLRNGDVRPERLLAHRELGDGHARAALPEGREPEGGETPPEGR